MHLIAIYDPAAAAVVVTIIDAPAAPTLTRIDSNGRHTVRTSSIGPTPLGPGMWEVRDREHATAGPVRYLATAGTARAIVDAAGLETAPAGPVLSNPIASTRDLELLQVTGIEGTRGASTTMHHVIGAPVPVVTYDVLSTRTGTMTVLTDGHATAAAVAEAVIGPTVHQLRQREHPGLDMYFIATAAATKPAAAGTRYWAVDIPYLEVAAPPTHVRPAPAWTWATLATAHGDYTDVHLEYLSWATLAEGRAA